jgi:hypothetical protein
MLDMAISLFFALAAVAALAVIRRSLFVGSARGQRIVAELAEIERRAPVTRPSAGFRLPPAFQTGLAAA